MDEFKGFSLLLANCMLELKINSSPIEAHKQAMRETVKYGISGVKVLVYAGVCLL